MKKTKLTLLNEMMKGRRGRMMLGLCAALLAVAMEFAVPQVIRFTVDSVLDEQPVGGWLSLLMQWLGGREFLRSHLWVCALAAVALGAIAMVANHLRQYRVLESAEYTAKRFRDTMYFHIQRLPYEWHVKIQTGDIIQRCTSDVDTVRQFLAGQLPELVRSVALVGGAITLMAFMDPWLTVFGCCLLPIFGVTAVWYHRNIMKGFAHVEEAEGAMQAAVQENLTGVRVIRAFGREKYEVERFAGINGEFSDRSLKMGNLFAFFWSWGDLVSFAQLLIMVFAGVFRCVSGELSLGTFITFYAYSNILIWPSRQLGRLISGLGRTSISLGRLLEIWKEKTEEEIDPSGETPALRGQVDFENVTFSYGDTPVLQDVSFSLSPGETLGILGATGSGKSTIAYLLTRLYDLPPEKGMIRIDGIDVQRIDRRHLRRHIGLVLQEPFLFSKTLRENLTVTKPGAAPHELSRVAGVAAIHETIEGFHDGYDTIVGERGVTLSGGQKQRVAIARMLLQDAPVMIFDDSLSAVDTETDMKIRASLGSQTSKAAAILISHRISTLMHANRILVLAEGKVVQYGSHAELLTQDGPYRKVYDMQAATVSENNEEDLG